MVTSSKVAGENLTHFFVNDVFVFEAATTEPQTVADLRRCILAMTLLHKQDMTALAEERDAWKKLALQREEVQW